MAETMRSTRPRRRRNLHWGSLIGDFTAGDYQVVPLLDSDALREEGECMHHCVGQRYPRWCKVGAVRVFSIRDFSGQRLATASIYFDFELGYWRLEQCRGLKNKEVCEIVPEQGAYLESFHRDAEPSDLYFLAREIVRRYQQAQDESDRGSRCP